MKALIVGAQGQLGRALSETSPDGVHVSAYGRQQLDITDRSAVLAAVGELRPDVIFNAAAYTAVDRAEQEEDRAFLMNAQAVGHLASAASDGGARLVQVSTDFVFDGRSGEPYAAEAATAPLGAYGRTKLAGERAAGRDALVVRTAWLHGPVGGNFVRTMLRLMQERPEVRVVADQVGTPTYAPGLAEALWTLALTGTSGLFHYTDAGVCSWYDFAVAIQEEALAAGLLDRAIPVVPVATSEYSTPARRPACSVLDKAATFAVLGGPAPHWRANLRKTISGIQAHG